MKYLILSAFILVSGVLTAGHTEPTPVDKKINPSSSTVLWTGKKVTGEHTGTINVKSGSVKMEDGKLIGGTVTMDLTTIACTDLKGDMAQKLVGHLMSDDFFGVPRFPEATFTITDVEMTREANTYKVTGDMTIKGITKPVTFKAVVDGTSIKGMVTINRAEYDIRYGSGSFFDNLGDKMIYDDFDLQLDLQF